VLGPVGYELKVCVTDAGFAKNTGGVGKGKKDTVDNKVLIGPKLSYGKLIEALVAAGGVEEEELYTDQKKLAMSSALLCRRLYEQLPADVPRFVEQPEMMSRLLFLLVVDEAHRLMTPKLKDVAEALWVPLICQSTLGGRGLAARRMLPALHVLFGLSNPQEPLASAVREAGLSLLTPRRATVDADGARTVPPLELTEDEDGTPVWNASALMPTLTSVSDSAMARRAEVVAAVIPDPDGSVSSRCGAVRVMCVADWRPPKVAEEVAALILGDLVLKDAKAALPPGVEPVIQLHPAALAVSMRHLMSLDPRLRKQALLDAASTLVAPEHQIDLLA